MTVNYQKVIGEGETIPLLPENEPERFFILEGGNLRRTLYCARGFFGSEYFRYFPISVEGSGHFQSDGGTGATWANGYWPSIRSDLKYLITTDNVNSTSAFPFRAFKRTGEGQNYYWEYLGDSATGTPPGNQQWRYCEYNPVYNEIVVNNLVYIDNDNDTFTSLSVADSFDTAHGNGSRDNRAALFTPDGESIIYQHVGTNNVRVFNRNTTSGARYQQSQVIAVPGSNSQPITYDKSRDQFLAAGNTSPKTIKVFEKTGGSWVEVEDLAANNPTWNGTGPNQINNGIDNIHVTEDGNYLIVQARTSSGGGGDFHFIFERSGGQWTLTTTKLQSEAGLPNTENLMFGQFPGTDVVISAARVAGGWPLTFQEIDGGNFTNIANHPYPQFGPVQESRKNEQGPSTVHFTDPDHPIVTNPYDKIFLPRNPYMFQSCDYHNAGFSGATTNDTAAGALVWHPFGKHVNEGTIHFKVNSSNGMLGNQPGPVPGSYSFIAGPRTYLGDEGPDSNLYIQNNLSTGSMVAVIKTPTEWWADHDDINSGTTVSHMRHIFSYGNSSASLSGSRFIALGLVTDGVIGKINLTFRNGSGTSLFGKWYSNLNLSLDSWYCIVVNQHADGNGPILWVNGQEQPLALQAGTISPDFWFSSITINKYLYIGSNNRESTSYRQSIEGMGFAAVSLHETPLSKSSIRQLAGSLNLL